MSIISSRKSLNSSILKSSIGRTDSLRKSKVLRFELEETSVKEILKDLQTNPDVKSYQNLIYKLTDSRLEEDELRKIISDSVECVSMINKDHVLLVETLLGIRWINKSLETIEKYHKFLIHLMTSKTEFLSLCLSKIIQCFLPSDEECEELLKGSTPTTDRETQVQPVHELLKKLFDTIPLTKLTLKKTLRSEFPFFKQSHFKITIYIENLLKILEYCPCFTNDVLVLIFENILLIDVNVTKDQIDQSEEEDEEEETNSLDGDFTDRMRLPLAETLDQCMEKILQFFEIKFSMKFSCDQKLIVETIFEYFDDHIIKTSTKHMHFFLFYICNLNEKFCSKYLDLLWRKIMDRGQSSTIRQTAIGYLASFLSRAKFIRVGVIKTYLERFCEWIHTYIKTCDYDKNRNPKAHVIFYSICQAVFYIVAFRSRELTETNEDLRFLLDLDLWPIVKHPLNPLNFCIPAIATIFENVTSKHQILFCQTIILRNASKCLTTVYINEQHRPEEILESVFPFDPYLLKKSGKRIHPLYVEYRGMENENSPDHLSSNQSLKRSRNTSTASHDLEDFIIFEEKKLKRD